MKKQILFLAVLFFIVFQLVGQNKSLILVHPTESNLRLFTYLVENKIITIDSLKVTGVYHQNEIYDYSKSEKFLKNNDYPYIKLVKISEEITLNELYKKNNCTPVFTNLFNTSNGIVFFGGPDITPSIYNQQMSLLTEMTDPYRHYFEVSLLFHLLGSSRNADYTPLMEQNKEYILYAICLGMQTMNVATGGTMIQDIPSEIYNFKYVEQVLSSKKNIQHKNYNNALFIDSTLFSGSFHSINITNAYPLTGSYESNLKPLVYSIHHQALGDIGKGLKVIATSIDGKVVEAVTHQKYPNVTGIQFHPERVYLYDSTIEYRHSPSEPLVSAKDILIENNSYNFHLEFWKTFSEKFNKIK